MPQKVKGAYITSVYQPKTFFNFSYATQIVEFLLNNIALLNKELQWQINNKPLKLYYNQDILRILVTKLFVMAQNFINISTIKWLERVNIK